MSMQLDRWLVFWLATIAALAAMAIAGSFAWRFNDRNHGLRSHDRTPVLAAGEVAAVSPSSSSAETATTKDFTQALPAHIDLQLVLTTISAACRAAGVELRGVQSQTRIATGQRLGVTTLNLHVQGSYPAIKNVLIDVMHQHESITVQAFSVRTIAATGTSSESSEAWATLSLWAQPAAIRAGT